MKRQAKPRPQTPPVCAEFHEDDGIDPRKFFKSHSPTDGRKTLQLCKQVLRTLNVVLAGGCREQILSELEVESVLPAPDSSRLLVTLQPPLQASETRPEAILQSLKRAQAWLRSEVAEAVSRKRVPDLVFEVHPREGEAHE